MVFCHQFMKWRDLCASWMSECATCRTGLLACRARSSSLDSPMPSGAAPQQPRLPRAKWTTQSDFLEQCSDFDPEEPIPADHPSQLAPLFAHPADQPIDTRLLFQQLEVAINGTEAMKNGSASWPKPLSCLQEPPNPGLLAAERPKIGALRRDRACGCACVCETLRTSSHPILV